MPGIFGQYLQHMLRRLFANYLVLTGVLAHIALAGVVLLWVYGQVDESGVIDEARRAVLGSLDGVQVTELAPGEPGAVNPALLELPAGVWHKLNSTGAFERQAHGGAAFDSLRGRITLFGSDTHRRNWDNSVRFFDVSALRWSQSYPADDPSTYRVNADGLAVAGDGGNEHPWAMHTFDAVEYDPLMDRLIVASYPAHMKPDKPWGFDKAFWRQIKRHPTWFYYIGEDRWEPMAGKAVLLFPYAAAFDPRRNEMIGVTENTFYGLSGLPPRWQAIGKGPPNAWHTSATFDSDLDAVVMYGTNRRANTVWQYRRGEERARKMPTPGDRPPGGESVPLVYHPGLQKVVALVVNRRTKRTETWLYATAADAWTRVGAADLPFDIGMNYDMAYDQRHDLLWLVANLPGDPVAVWALRLQR